MAGGEKRISGRAAHPEACAAMASLRLPCVATGVALRAVWGLSGATPRGQPWTTAVTLLQGRNGLSGWRMAMLSTLREPSLCRQGHRELLRSVLFDVTPIISATACHQRNCVERYSRYRASITGISLPRGLYRYLLLHACCSPSIVIGRWMDSAEPSAGRPSRSPISWRGHCVSRGHATLGLTASQKEQEMPHSTLDKVLADAQALSPEEQRRLRAKLDEWLTPGPACRTEAEFEQQLVAQGILSAVPPPITDGAPARQRTRLQVHGTPLSETILEDRR
jgi:hypothetical protein